jgi:hypothetical protein
MNIVRCCLLVFLPVALTFPAHGVNQAVKGSPTPMPLQSSHAPVVGPDSGTAIETLHSGGYTYVLLDTGKEKVWVAGPQTSVRPGDRIRVQNAMPMRDFVSKSLNRTFETIYFASALVPAASAMTAGEKPGTAMGSSHPAVTQQPVVGITQLANGYSIADLYSRKAELTGKKVQLRAQVVKISRGIMGKNWMHIQDGTGGEKQNDLTINSKADANKGDILLVTGILVRDKDIGMGYRYELMIEDAEIKIEKPSSQP